MVNLYRISYEFDLSYNPKIQNPIHAESNVLANNKKEAVDHVSSNTTRKNIKLEETVMRDVKFPVSIEWLERL